MFTLKESGCQAFELTEEEYRAFVQQVEANRVREVAEAIGNLVKVVGTPKAKHILRQALKDLD